MQTMIANVCWLACFSDPGPEVFHHIILESHLKLLTLARCAKLVSMLMWPS